MTHGPTKFGTLFALLFSLIVTIGAHPAAIALHRTDAPRKLKRPSHQRLSHHGRWLRWNPLFRPSHESLLRQNEEVDRLQLPRIQDDDELEALKASHALVPIEESETLRIEHSLDPSRRYCRPWTRDFVQDLSEVYYRQFHDKIKVNSAVR